MQHYASSVLSSASNANRCETWKGQHKVRESKQPQDCNEKTAQSQPRQIKQNQNVLLNYMQRLKPQNLLLKWQKLSKTQRKLTINTKAKVAFW